MAIEDFKDSVPAFLPEVFFVGQLEGWAMFESLVGGLQKRQHQRYRHARHRDRRGVVGRDL